MSAGRWSQWRENDDGTHSRSIFGVEVVVKRISGQWRVLFDGALDPEKRYPSAMKARGGAQSELSRRRARAKRAEVAARAKLEQSAERWGQTRQPEQVEQVAEALQGYVEASLEGIKHGDSTKQREAAGTSDSAT